MEEHTLTPQGAVEALEAGRRDYMEQLTALNRKSGGVRDILAGLLGNNASQQMREEIITTSHAAIRGCVDDLLRALEHCPPDEARDCTARAVEVLLLYPAGKDQQMEVSLAALDGLATPLVPLLDRGQLEDAIARYKKRVPPRLMFPNQKKLYQAMQARLKELQ